MPAFEQAICGAFGLGEPRGRAEAVTGGWTHRVWRLTAATGHYAVKELVAHPGEEDIAEKIRAAFPFERRAHAEHFPMAEPVPSRAGDVLAVVQRDHGPVSVRVHRWVDAAEVPGGVAGTPAQAGRIGRLMAWLHRIGAEMIESARPPVPWKPVPDEEWRERAAAAAVLGADWAHPLRDIIPGLSALAGDLERWLAEPTPAVVSHGDLNQTNWRRAPGGRLMLFDWDGAGIVSTDLEVGSAALEWAGVSRGAPAMDTLAALIAGYRANGGTLRLRGPALFAGWLRGTVWWLGHCVDRIIAGRETDDALLAGAHFHVRECLEKVPRVYRSLDAWTAQAGL